MNTYLTEFKAIHPQTGKLELWCGDDIEAESFEEAEKYCIKNKGHLTVIGILLQSLDVPENYNPYKDN